MTDDGKTMTGGGSPAGSGAGRRRGWRAAGAVSIGLLILVGGVAMLNGPAARAGRAYGKGLEALQAGRYAEADAHFAEAAALAPAEDSYRLAKAESALRAWDTGRLPAVRTELEALAGGGGETAVRARELLARAGAALRETHAARGLAREARDAEALAALERAVAAFPESNILRAIALSQKATVAFAAADYESHLAASREAFALDPQAAHLAANVAAGYACRYAVGGDEAARSEALALLETAGRLAREGTAEDREIVADAAERIRHRLESREIITRAEYDRRFRSR